MVIESRRSTGPLHVDRHEDHVDLRRSSCAGQADGQLDLNTSTSTTNNTVQNMQFTSMSRPLRIDIGRRCTDTLHSKPVTRPVRHLTLRSRAHQLRSAQQQFNGTPVLPYRLINDMLGERCG